MGNCAELCAKEKEITRAAQDEFAAETYRRALRAQPKGQVQGEIAPVEVAARRARRSSSPTTRSRAAATSRSWARCAPAFQKDGTVTAGNASSINDGAAALVLTGADDARRRAAASRSRASSRTADHAQAPEWFTTAPARRDRASCSRAPAGSKDDVDLWEINEAFAVVSIANNQLLGLDPAKVNVCGGAVALGHPIGASGARVLVTLLYALRDAGKRRGVASLCIGGGEGHRRSAVERV